MSGELLKYRTIYLRPNGISEDALAVAVVVDAGDRLVFRGVAHPTALGHLDILFGYDYRKGVLDALLDLREVFGSSETLDQLNSPIDFLSIGEPSSFYSTEPGRDIDYLLHQLSSLYMRVNPSSVARSRFNQRVLVNRLRDEVSFLDTFVGTSLFQGAEFSLPSNVRIQFPIYGDEISGAIFSFRSSDPRHARMSAEATMARMFSVRNQVDRKLNLYVLAPDESYAREGKTAKIDASINELRLIGDELGVGVCGENSISSLARRILFDERKHAA